MFFALALVVLGTQALAAQASYFSHPGNDVGALCAGKSVDLITYTQLEYLRIAVPQLAENCPSNIKASIEDLFLMIKDARWDLCSVSTIDKFKQFYVKYLDNSHDKNKERLPKSLRRFTIAFGMQMSNLCKRNMVEVLAKEVRDKLLNEEDFRALEQLTSDDGPVAQILSAFGESADEIIMPGDLAPLLEKRVGVTSQSLEQQQHEKIFMQTSTSSYIKKLQSVCQARFAPVYEPLILPLVRLANLGFNYKDDPLKCELKCTKTQREIGQWSRIVFMCEALRGIQIVEDKTDQEQGADGAGMVRILTKEDAAAIDPSGAESQDAAEEVIQNNLVYKPKTYYFLEDLIYDKSNGKLLKAIKALKTSRTEADIIKRKIAHKGYALIKSQLKRGHVGFLISSSFRSILTKQKLGNSYNAGSTIMATSTSPAEQIVTALDEIVEKESGPDGKVAMRDSNLADKSKNNGVPVWLVLLMALAVLLAICL